MHVLLILALCLCWTTLSVADDRLLIDAKVNDQAVRLIFDTGTEHTTLFGQTARRLNLKVTEPPPNPKLKPWQVALGVSEECRLTIGQSTIRARFGILNLPEYTRFMVDGVLAWADLRNNIFRILADTKELSVLKKLPENICQWSRWNIEQDSRFLEVKLPGTSEIDGTMPIRLLPKTVGWVSGYSLQTIVEKYPSELQILSCRDDLGHSSISPLPYRTMQATFATGMMFWELTG